VSLLSPLAEARSLLSVTAADDRRAIKRAYRRAVAQHPPDRDPQQFRKVREAYELLCSPELALAERLVHPLPLVAPPTPPVVPDPAPPGTLALALLRACVTNVDARQLLPDGALDEPVADDPGSEGNPK
jgi:hypothetical protein